MIEDALGCIDYDELGTGPAILFVPGSCSTGAAWRSVISHLNGQYRVVTTSLSGYGGTTERRTTDDRSIWRVASALEEVTRQAGDRVHLVGHSFGGLASLAVALRGRVSLKSLTILDVPAPQILLSHGEPELYAAFRQMTDAYFDAFRSGNADAIASVIDFYGGPGTFASWPSAVSGYAVKTTATNLLDWESAYGFDLSADLLASVNLPVLVVTGEHSHPAVICANTLISRAISGSTRAIVPNASHFMIATHAGDVARLIVGHVNAAEM